MVHHMINVIQMPDRLNIQNFYWTLMILMLLSVHSTKNHRFNEPDREPLKVSRKFACYTD